MNTANAIAVFCGSRFGNDPAFREQAERIGCLLAQKDITLVYGGGRNGLMGAVADAALKEGGHVIGILPETLAKTEHRHDDISELIIVDSMHTRKKMLFERFNRAIILPGGYGTLDELFEMLTWNQLSLHNKTIFFLNTNGFYNHVLAHIDKMLEEGFLYLHPAEKIIILNQPEEILNFL